MDIETEDETHKRRERERIWASGDLGADMDIDLWEGRHGAGWGHWLCGMSVRLEQVPWYRALSLGWALKHWAHRRYRWMAMGTG